MATTKNITMKQFNGTDYDTLYPKTKVEQIENLTPSSIGAVAKSGDTMTGNYLGLNNGKGMIVASDDAYNRLFMIRSTFNDNWSGLQMEASLSGTSDPVFSIYKNVNQAVTQVGTMLHTGNAQSLGFSKIAAGSYVGTGTYGPSNPCSITFSFKPKIVIFPNNTVYNASGKSMIAVDCLTTSYQDVDGTLGYEVHAKFDTTTNTLYWYSYSSDFHQLNGAGDTYYWVAIG